MATEAYKFDWFVLKQSHYMPVVFVISKCWCITMSIAGLLVCACVCDVFVCVVVGFVDFRHVLRAVASPIVKSGFGRFMWLFHAKWPSRKEKMGYDLVRLGLGQLSSDAFFALAGASAETFDLFLCCKQAADVCNELKSIQLPRISRLSSHDIQQSR